MTFAIRAEGLAKRYRIGLQRAAYGTLRDTLAAAASGALRSRRISTAGAQSSEIWALQDVSFDVPPGQAIGIIGKNGSGKTTLLKILSRVTRPTRGRAWVRGRVGSLLEVGTGFHQELTGRENIYLNAAILGMRRVEIERKLDEIVAFAEGEQFLDTPVKRYSSGMYMRLAFAVAAHLEPDILVVDEVLAVGDAAFQRKCLGQMEDVAREGRTVLLVSHNMPAVQGLCRRVIWLDEGRVVADGRPTAVVSRYLQTSGAPTTVRAWPNRSDAPGDDRVRFRRVSVRPAVGSPGDPITMRTAVVIDMAFWNLVPGVRLNPYLRLTTADGIVAFESSPPPGSDWYGKAFPVGLFHSECHIPGDLLIEGQYRVTVSVVRDVHHALYELPDVLVFEVHDTAELRGSWYGEMAGVVKPLLPWSTRLVPNDPSGGESRRER